MNVLLHTALQNPTDVTHNCLVLLAFASIFIHGFSLLEIHSQDIYSLLDMYVFRNVASSSTKVGSVFLCRRYMRQILYETQVRTSQETHCLRYKTQPVNAV
jgi:hypothetical protein